MTFGAQRDQDRFAGRLGKASRSVLLGATTKSARAKRIAPIRAQPLEKPRSDVSKPMVDIKEAIRLSPGPAHNIGDDELPVCWATRRGLERVRNPRDGLAEPRKRRVRVEPVDPEAFTPSSESRCERRGNARGICHRQIPMLEQCIERQLCSTSCCVRLGLAGRKHQESQWSFILGFHRASLGVCHRSRVQIAKRRLTWDELRRARSAQSIGRACGPSDKSAMHATERSIRRTQPRGRSHRAPSSVTRLQQSRGSHSMPNR